MKVTHAAFLAGFRAGWDQFERHTGVTTDPNMLARHAWDTWADGSSDWGKADDRGS